MSTIEVNGILNFKDESGNINTVYPVTKAENVEGLEEIKVTIDSALSATSTNPVQNKVIKAEINKLIPKSGGTMTGTLTLSGDPTSNLHAATKQYVDTGLDEKVDAQDLTSHTGNKNNPHGVTAAQVGAVPKSGGTMTGALTLSGDPSSDLHAVTKQYVDKNTSFNSVFEVGDKFETMRTDLGDNWTLCNGASLSRDSYPELSQIIGYAPINDEINRVLPTSGSNESNTFRNIVYGNGYYVMLYSAGGNAKIYYTTDPVNGTWTKSSTSIYGSSISSIEFINGRFFIIEIGDGGSFYNATLWTATNPSTFTESCQIMRRSQYSTDSDPVPIKFGYSNGYYFVLFDDMKETTGAAIYYSASYSTDTWSKVAFNFGGRASEDARLESLSMVDGKIVIGYYISGAANSIYFGVGTNDPRNSAYTEVHLSDSAFNGSQYGASFYGVQKINGLYIAQGGCRVSSSGDSFTFIATSKSLTSGWTIYPSQPEDLGTHISYNNGTYIIPYSNVNSDVDSLYYTNAFNPIVSEATSWKRVTVSYTQGNVSLINNRYYILAYSSYRSTSLGINVIDTNQIKLPEISSSDSFYTYIKVKGE